MFTDPVRTENHFWDSVDATGILAHKDLIIVGDLNFTTSSAEVWGHSTLQDSLAGYFKSFF
jgi:hypothetical protein